MMISPRRRLAFSFMVLTTIGGQSGRRLVAASGSEPPTAEESAALDACARLLLQSPGADEQRLLDCRVPLLWALHQDRIPEYKYNAADCHFWASYATRDRSVEGARRLDFNRLASFRLLDPFLPPLRASGTVLYVGAHRSGEDSQEFQRQAQGLQMHLFEPSRTFFRELQEAFRGVPGVFLHNFGLGSRTSHGKLQLSGTASRAVAIEDEGGGTGEDPEDGTEQVLILSAAEAWPKLLDGGGRVELLHVNCEGCEYDVITSLSESGVLENTSHVQIATHLLGLTEPAANLQEAFSHTVQLSSKSYCKMHETLAKTHERIWGLPWVWERWRLRL